MALNFKYQDHLHARSRGIANIAASFWVVLGAMMVLSACNTTNPVATTSTTPLASDTMPAQKNQTLVQSQKIGEVQTNINGQVNRNLVVQNKPNVRQDQVVQYSTDQSLNKTHQQMLARADNNNPRSLTPARQTENQLSNQQNLQLASLDTKDPDLGNQDGQLLAYADPNDPELLAQQRIDRLFPTIRHYQCKSGWATPPDRLDAARIDPQHRYYMEMRLRHTPLLPVGHTYIAYGRLSELGQPLDEHVIMLSPIGGYGGAALASAVPMPGVLKPVTDDCKIKPIAAYRVSLSAQDYEKLLLRIRKANKEKPAYALFAYNCNHFASDIAKSVGILPPKNAYVPALQYIYGVIEANEGYDPRKVVRR